MLDVVLGRVRLLVVALLLCAGCTDESTGGKSSSSSPPTSSTSPTTAATRLAQLEPPCPSAPSSPVAVESATAANELLAAQDLPAWEAADIGASTLLSDGRVVWVFGDTVRSGMTPGLVANSMLVSGGHCASQLLTPEKGPVIPDVSTAVVHWPMSAVSWADDTRERLVVLCSRTRRGGSGDPLDFTFLGTSAALFDVPAGGVPRLVRVTRVTEDDPDLHQVNWGAASFTDDRWIYVYGTRLTGEEYVFGRELYAARVPLTSPTKRSTWRFWDGSAWQPDPDRATAVMDAEGGVSQTLSVDALDDGRFLAVSKRDGDLGEFVYSWLAPSPVGPWKPHKGVPAPNDLDAGLLKYAPLAHPQIPLGTGRLLVGVSRNTTDFRRLVEEPELGVVEFVEVALP